MESSQEKTKKKTNPTKTKSTIKNNPKGQFFLYSSLKPNVPAGCHNSKAEAHETSGNRKTSSTTKYQRSAILLGDYAWLFSVWWLFSLGLVCWKFFYIQQIHCCITSDLLTFFEPCYTKPINSVVPGRIVKESMCFFFLLTFCAV